MCKAKIFVRDKPWALMGDFYAALNLEDSTLGALGLSIAMREFKYCVEEIEVVDVNSTGLHLTWNQKPNDNGGILMKLDQIMGNVALMTEWPGLVAIFQPYRISDHSPTVLRLPSAQKRMIRPFKFFNFLASKADF